MSFFQPKDNNELVALLANKNKNTYLASGVTDLMIKLRKNKCVYYSLIDLCQNEEMKYINEIDEEIIIGACVTMTELEENHLINKYIPALSKSASLVGSTQIRNLATIGGNVANGAQCADTVPVLMAYNAKVVTINGEGLKKIKTLDEIIMGLEKNNLEDDEAIIEFIIRKTNHLSAFAKVGARKSVSISKVNLCIKLEIDKQFIKRAVVYIGSVGIKALKAPMIEQSLIGQKIHKLDIDKIKKAVAKQVESNIPNRSSKHYKKVATLGILFDALEDLDIVMEGAYE